MDYLDVSDNSGILFANKQKRGLQKFWQTGKRRAFALVVLFNLFWLKSRNQKNTMHKSPSASAKKEMNFVTRPLARSFRIALPQKKGLA